MTSTAASGRPRRLPARGDDRRDPGVRQRRIRQKHLRADENCTWVNFRLVRAPFEAARFTTPSPTAWPQRHWGASPTWTLSNHDVDREVNARYGGGPTRPGPGSGDGYGDAGTARRCSSTTARNSASLQCRAARRGAAGPGGERSGHTERGRDGCRVPMPWEGKALLHSASPPTRAPGCRSHLNGPGWTVERQAADDGSTLNFFRESDPRRTYSDSTATTSRGSPRRERHGVPPGGVLCVLNAGDRAVPLDGGKRLLAASSALTGGRLAPTPRPGWSSSEGLPAASGAMSCGRALLTLVTGSDSRKATSVGTL